MIHFFARRRLRKQSRELLHHAAQLRHMREDLLSAQDLARLDGAAAQLRAALADRDWDAVESRWQKLYETIQALTPRRSAPSLRENLEVAVVAIAVAMAFRTYFLQPFKIPTGSMQPTLYGIQIDPQAQPTVFDRWPLKPVKWLATGQWYVELRAKSSGVVHGDPAMAMRTDSSAPITFYVGGTRHKVPSLTGLRVRLGQEVARGQTIWAGLRTAGDHVLVNKVIWNLRRPRRGEVIVFNTDRIPTLPPNTHYIKRLVGLPGESLSISPPELLIDGKSVREPPAIARIVERRPGYDGYQLVEARAAGLSSSVLRTPQDVVRLGEDEYFALGDNTGNSRDSRYWGPVKQQNLLGPATLVYWPFSTRWGLIR